MTTISFDVSRYTETKLSKGFTKIVIASKQNVPILSGPKRLDLANGVLWREKPHRPTY